MMVANTQMSDKLRFGGPFRPTLDCRRHVRVAGGFDAFVLKSGITHSRLRCVNLSVGGGLLEGDVGPAVGASIQLVLTGPNRMTVVVTARVLPQDGRSKGATPVCFPKLNPWNRSEIDELIRSSLRAQVAACRSAALVVDRSGVIQRSLRDRLAAYADEVFTADTPVMAFTHFMRADHRIAGIYVRKPKGSCTPTELARFFAHEFNGVRVALLVEETAGRAMRQTGQGGDDFRDLEVVEPPWAPLRLASILLPRKPVAPDGEPDREGGRSCWR